MMRSNRLIFLLSDFGYKDYYIAGMKARILSINPKATIVDITHAISKWNTMEGAFILWQVTPYIPEKAIIVGVIDPGVGTRRRGIIIKTDKHYFIGPDNGLLYLAALQDKILTIIDIDINKLDNKISFTFHGRDVFAPIAAYISLGEKVEAFGSKINLSEINKTRCKKTKITRDRIIGYIVYIDEFGNLITNIPCDLLAKWLVNTTEKNILIMKYRNKKNFLKRVNTFEELEKEEIGVICDSTDLIEIVMNKKNVSKRLKISIGDVIQLIKVIS